MADKCNEFKPNKKYTMQETHVAPTGHVRNVYKISMTTLSEETTWETGVYGKIILK